MRAVNLIPAEQRSGASVGAGRSQGGAYAVLALALGVAVLAFLYGSARHEVSKRRTQAATINAQAQHAQAEAEQLAPYTSFVALRAQREQAVDTLVESRFDWAHVFHEFGRVIPARTSISSLSGTIGGGTSNASSSSSSSSGAAGAAAGAPVASATPPGSVPSFALSGCATSQRAVAQTLQRLRLIDGVSEVTLESSTSSAASASGGGGSGTCPAGATSFSAQITFEPLPAASKPATSNGAATRSEVSAK